MKKPLFYALICLGWSIWACNSPKQGQITTNKSDKNMFLNQKKATPPVAEKVKQELSLFGDTRTDNYYWMRLSDEQKEAKTPDATTQKVLDYLNAENTYREEVMQPAKGLQDSLFEEIKGRIKQTDMSVPYKDNGYFYGTRYEEGKEYAIYFRKKETLDAKEAILLNANDLAKGHSYYAVGGRAISPNNKVLAYGEDVVSRRQYTVRFKNLETEEYLPDVIENTTGGVVWANDNQTVFYTKKDAALRSFQIYRHILGTKIETDVLIWEEKDEEFSTYIYKTKSNKYLVIGSYATISQEYQFLEADKPMGKFKLFQARQKNLEYSIDHYENEWYIRTNHQNATNFKIMKCPLAATELKNWEEYIPHNNKVYIADFELFKDRMVLSERVNGNTKIKIKGWKSEPYYLDFAEEAYTVYLNVNPDFETDLLRLDYTSLTTPNSTYDYNCVNKNLYLLKQQEVIGSFKIEDYQSERIFAKASDGTQIPISIVYKKGFKKDGSQPLLLYGYGSYGASMDPYFSSVRLSLLDRGFAFAIAHIRGGQELGRDWYENGKYLKKKNTFTDFIACADFLIKNKYVANDKLFAEGGSAGGLLMGAVVNMRPDLWRGVLAGVPFVDVLTTMLDETIPLTTGEFEEWGNPKNKEYYDYMKSYSPYDNVVAKNYPAMLVTTGYFDSQVQYWEPAKWVAKLRELKTDNNPLLLYCNMDTGHGGASGRFEKYKEVAMEYAFLLSLLGITE